MLHSRAPVPSKRIFSAVLRRLYRRSAPARPPPPPPPPTPPKPPRKPVSFTVHGVAWEDSYSWMADLSDATAMRHMDMCMEQEEKYAEAAMVAAGADRLQRKLQLEMASRMASDPCSPPVKWGPWLYYRRIEEGKQYPVLCRRSAKLHEEFVSFSEPSAGFDFMAGRRVEQKILDYNQEAERFGGYAYEELSEVSPDHRYLAYTMYDKDKDSFTLSVRDLATGSLCSKPQADRVANLSWVYLINAADPLSGMTLIWECESHANCIVEHHQDFFYLFTNAARSGMPVDSHYLLGCAAADIKSQNWESLLVEEPGVSIEDIDFCDTHMVLIIKEGMKYRLCSIALPLSGSGPMHLAALHPCFLPLPSHVCQISPGPNYDYYSSTMRFTISSPVMPDAVVDYYLSNAKWITVQQQNVLSDRTRILYGSSAVNDIKMLSSLKKHDQMHDFNDSDGVWNELSEFYACEYYDVPSNDEVLVPLTIVYSRKQKQEGNPGLLHGHGAYGELLDKRWRSELKSLLDRGWVVAYADVRGGGGLGRKWHYDGRRTKKQNSIDDYISCAEFLIAEGFVTENRLAGWGYSAGGLLVASAINNRPDLFRAAVLKVPFLDTCNTLLYPILPLDAADYEEFGYPVEVEDFLAMKQYSPYDNIPKNVKFPSVMVTSSFNTRFGVWEAAKWVARVRENTIYDPKHPVILNLTTDLVEDNKYLQIKELALETAFLIKMVSDS